MHKVLARLAFAFAGLAMIGVPSYTVTATTRTADRAGELAAIEKTTESIRQLSHKRTVRAVFAGTTKFKGIVTAELRRDTPQSDITLSQKELTLLGWLKKTDNYRKIVFGGISAQVIGLYDPKVKTLYVLSNNNEAFGVRRDVIAHEYTHALQDQYYTLNKLLPDDNKVKYRNSDRISAIHGLTEGDAVTTQVLYVSRNYSSSEYAAWVKANSAGSSGPSLPKALQREFDFPYDQAVIFAETLYKSGGMAAINRAYSRLPSSTYEIMHPDAYMHGWRPVNVTLHQVAGFGDWKQLDDDVMGAFGYQLLIWQYLPKATATKITDAYRGDRYVFLEKGSSDAALFVSQWATNAATVAARNTLIAAVQKRYSRSSVSGTAMRVVTTPDGAVTFRVQGVRLTMAYGPSRDVAVKLVSAGTT